MEPTLTAEQQRNENVAQAIRFGDNKALSKALSPTIPSETPIPTTETINSTQLQPQPSVTFPTPPTTPDISVDEAAIGATGASMMEDLQTRQEREVAQAEAAKQASQQDYLDAILNQQGFEGFYAQEAEKRGIQDISNQVAAQKAIIRSEQAARNEMKTRLEQQGGGLKIGANAEYQNFARDSLFRETNAVIQMGVYSDNLAAAESAATRMANAYFRQEQNDLDRRKTLYEDNKALFDKQEQREFDLQFNAAKRELDRQEADLKLLQETKLEALKMLQLNGDPNKVASAVQDAKTVEDIVRIAGTAGVTDLLSREQLRASIANSWSSYNLNELKRKSELDKQKQIESAIENGEIVLDDGQKDMAFKIGKEYEAESAEFKKQVGAYNRILASGTEPSAAGDLALIFNYMKLLDPGSVVRESEFATAQNAAGIPDRIRAQYNNLLKGERLADAQRNDFLGRSQKLYDQSLEQQMELEDRYREQAVKVFGLPENAADTIIQDIRAVGAVSDVAFGIQLNNMSISQMANLVDEGLLSVTR